MKARRYIKEEILACIKPEGSTARDIIDEVGESLGESISMQRLSSYLRCMFDSGEVSREPIGKYETRSHIYFRR